MWQAKLLSQGGRLVLVNLVLSNLPLYYFLIFKAPKLRNMTNRNFSKGILLERRENRCGGTLPCKMENCL